MTPHNEAKLEEIAKTVLMPGDPLRAKLIADTYLENPKLVNSVRNIFAYTGTYKNKEITVMASGMGMPSMGIYSYELFKFYDVENIIRIGSCGGYTKDLKLFDLVLVKNSYTEGNYALAINNDDCHFINASSNLNETIKNTAIDLDIPIAPTNISCVEAFDVYTTDINKVLARLPKEYDITCAEMESFALLYNAKLLNKNAACIATVVDSYYYKEHTSAEQRQNSLEQMIKLGLEAAVKLS